MFILYRVPSGSLVNTNTDEIKHPCTYKLNTAEHNLRELGPEEDPGH